MAEGKNLEKLLEEDRYKYSLEESAEIMKKILAALDGLHQEGKLHLALCPENILIFPEHVLLLNRRREWYGDKTTFAYAAPEVQMKNFSEIGPPADVYSACAVFFRLLMRRRMGEEEVIGMGLWRCFSGRLEIFSGAKEEQRRKTVQILLKGLHPLPRKRYPRAAELMGEIEDLVCCSNVTAPAYKDR